MAATLKVNIEVDDSGKIKLNGVEQSLGHVETRLGSVASMAKMAGVAFGGFLTIAGARRAYQAVEGWLKEADAIGKHADAIGLSTAALQEYEHAARISGVSTEKFDQAVSSFTKKLGELRFGTGELSEKLRYTDKGLLSSLQSATDTEKALDILFKGLDKTTNAMDKAAISAAAFGRTGGVAMANMVRGGYQELERMREEAEALGIVLDENLIRNAERANDQLEIMNRIMKTQLITAAVQLSPAIIKIADAMGNMVSQVNNLVTGLGELSRFETLLKILAFGIPVGQNVGERPGEVEDFLKKKPPATAPGGGISPTQGVLNKMLDVGSWDLNMAKFNQFKTELKRLDSSITFVNVDKEKENIETVVDWVYDAKTKIMKFGAWYKMDNGDWVTAEQKKEIEKLAKEWEKTSKQIGSSFTDAMYDSTTEGFKAFEDFGRKIKEMFIKMWLDKAITQPIIMPMVNQAAGMFGFGADAGVAGNKTSGFAGMMGSDAFGVEGGATYGQVAGAGAVGYGIGGGVGAAGGAILGSIIPGVGTAIGAMVGGALGTAVGGMFGGGEKKVEEQINILWETLGGQVEAVTDDMAFRHLGAIEEVKKSIEIQVDFYRQVGNAFGVAFQDFSEEFSGGVSKISISGLSGLAANWEIIKQLGVDATDQAKIAFQETFAAPTSSGWWDKNLEGIVNEGWSALSTGGQSGLSEWLQSGTGKPDEKAYAQVYQIAKANGTQAIEDFLKSAEEGFQEIYGTFAPSITNALSAGLNDSANGVDTFLTSLRGGLADTVKSAVIQGFTNQAIMPVLLGSFGEITNAEGDVTRPSLTNSLKDYMSGMMDGDTFQTYLSQMTGDFEQNINSLAPIFSDLTNILGFVNDALGVNTDALSGSSSSVESWISEMTGSSLNPSQSMAAMGMMNSQLYDAALADPSQMGAWTSFQKGSYLPMMQGISPDYQSVFDSIMAQAYGLQDAWGGGYDDSKNPPGDWQDELAGATGRSNPYSASGGIDSIGDSYSTSRSRSSGGDTNNDDLAAKIAPMLQDIAGAVREGREISGELSFKESGLVRIVGRELLNDPGFVQGMRRKL